MSTYAEFLAAKALTAPLRGLPDAPPISAHLFPFQAECVRFGLRAGSFGLFLDTGLGKTICELEWGIHAAQATNGRTLILTPLAVARQIEAEGRRFGYPVRVLRSQDDAGDGINVCNYDRLHLLDPQAFGAVALDEASILKNFTGKMSQALIDTFAGQRFKTAATATPAPNDHTELAQHASFLNVLTRSEMLVRFFINDSGDTGTWRLKGHAVTPFFDWMASWARMAEHPRDLGDDISGFDLPPLDITRHRAHEPDAPIGGGLFGGAVSATEMHDVKRQTIAARAAVVAALVNAEPDEPWVIWCDTDYEADALAAMMPSAVEVRGSHPIERKEAALAAFADGTKRHLISKPSVCGWGLNWQHCARVAFVGRTFSYEAWYQAVRRCWRFGQARPVHVHLVVAEGEDTIGRVIDRKADDHAELKAEMRAAMSRAIGAEKERRVTYEPQRLVQVKDWIGHAEVRCIDSQQGHGYSAIHGDCVSVISQLPDACVGLSVYSPPFSNLFVYSDSAADMGNAANDGEFLEHYGYLLRELARVTKPGRLSAVHCSDLPLQKWKDGVIGIKDLSGDIIRAHEDAGWTLHARITIWKSPVVEMTRTKALGLLYKQLQKDSSRSRAGMADYLLVFRRDGENAEPIAHTPAEFSLDQWQEWASPVWMTVRQTRTLNVDAAREDKDERHLCPLQLDVIERALTLWSNPGDVILSPFMGIGSEGVTAMQMHRKFLGVELKSSYFEQAVQFLAAADNQLSLLDV